MQKKVLKKKPKTQLLNLITPEWESECFEFLSIECFESGPIGTIVQQNLQMIIPFDKSQNYANFGVPKVIKSLPFH